MLKNAKKLEGKDIFINLYAMKLRNIGKSYGRKSNDFVATAK